MQEAPLNGERIIEIEIERLKDFKNNPFKIREDTELEQLMSSVERYGVLCPLIVRPTLDATYEIISGHRRKYVAALLGYRKMPVIIRHKQRGHLPWLPRKQRCVPEGYTSTFSGEA